jgi:hypothetical protein
VLPKVQSVGSCTEPQRRAIAAAMLAAGVIPLPALDKAARLSEDAWDKPHSGDNG